MALSLAIFIILSPFSPILFRRVDLWYAAGQYFQIGILILFAYSFFEKTKQGKNLPLSLLTLYIGLNTLWYWYQGLVNGVHNFVVLMPFVNFLCFLIFYKVSFSLNREWIERILKFLSYSICAYLFLCVLQYFDLFPYFKTWSLKAYGFERASERVVGFLGNETRNALYLALCLPLFFNRNRFSTLCACLVWTVIGISCSASAILVGLIITVFFSCFYRLSKFYYLFIILGIIGAILLRLNELQTFFNFHGRLDFWKALWPLIKDTSIFGSGLGSMNILKLKGFDTWRHAHNEYYQVWVTVGILGLVSVLYCIWEYFRGMLKDRLGVTLTAIFLGFCIASLIYSPSHLWLSSMIGMMSYSFHYVLKQGNDNIKEIK